MRVGSSGSDTATSTAFLRVRKLKADGEATEPTVLVLGLLLRTRLTLFLWVCVYLIDIFGVCFEQEAVQRLGISLSGVSNSSWVVLASLSVTAWIRKTCSCRACGWAHGSASHAVLCWGAAVFLFLRVRGGAGSQHGDRLSGDVEGAGL